MTKKICFNCWYCVSYQGKYVCEITDKEIKNVHEDSCKKFNSGESIFGGGRR